MQEAKLEEATRSSAELSDHVDYVESTLAECVSLLTEARALGGKPVSLGRSGARGGANVGRGGDSTFVPRRGRS